MPRTCLSWKPSLQMQVILLLYFFYQTKQIKNAMYIATSEWAGVDHNARPSFRNKTLFDLCTAALFRGTSNVFLDFLPSFCTMVLGLESTAFTSLALSRNSSRPYSMHNIGLKILHQDIEITWEGAQNITFTDFFSVWAMSKSLTFSSASCGPKNRNGSSERYSIHTVIADMDHQNDS